MQPAQAKLAVFPSLRNRAWSGSTVLQYWSTFMRLRSLNSCTFKDLHFSKSLLNCMRIFWLRAFGCKIFYSPIVRIFEGKLFRCQKLKFIVFVTFPNVVKQSLHSIHWGFYKWKIKDDDQKSLLRNWQLIQNFFTAHLPILVRCKIKGAVGAVCAFTAQLVFRYLITHYCTRWRCNFKGPSQDGGRADISKNLCASLFNKYLSNEPNFGRIQLAGQYL
jgi:hypothetical protein